MAVPSILTYKKSYLKHDVIAAIIVTALAVPQSLAFAVIVGLPPVTGLYTAMVGPIVFALLAFTRRTVVGPDSATTAVVASGAVLVAQAGTAEHISAVATICLIAAVLLIIMSLTRLGFLAALISRPVLVGFFAGVGLQLAIASLPAMLGISSSGTVVQHLAHIVNGLGGSNMMTITIAILVVGIVAIFRKTIVPGELVALAFAVLFSMVFHVANFHVAMVGALPSGLPHIAVPSFSLDTFITLFPAGLSVALVVLAQGSSIIRSTAMQHNDKVRLDEDLLAFGVANAASALFQGFSVNGSLARSQASEGAHGKTQLVNVLSGAFIAGLLVFGTGVFQFTPQVALSSIVFVIGLQLIRVRELMYIWHTHRTEFFVAAAATIGTLTFGVLQGVFIAVIVSLAERLSRQYKPRDALLLQDGVLSDWAIERLGSNGSLHDVACDGVLVYSFDGSLFFENSAYFVHRVKRFIKESKSTVHTVIVDAGAIDSIDYTAAEELKQFVVRLHEKSIGLMFAHVSPGLQRQLEDFGVTAAIDDRVFTTLTQALKVACKEPETTKPTEKGLPKKPAKAHQQQPHDHS